MTGGGRLVKSINALTAKFMFDRLSEEEQQNINMSTIQLLVSGSGVTPSEADTWANKLDKVQYYGLVAEVFLRRGVPPVFAKCFVGGRWNQVNNPLAGISDRDEEVRMARVDIFKRYQVDVNL